MSTNVKELGLIEPILLALFEEGYTTPTPIQAQSIPIILDGKDLLGCAQTGTGKTAAFTLPIIQLLLQHKPAERRKKIRTLIVTPTRELAIQIAENFEAYGRHTPLNCTVIFGGVGQGPQVTALRNGVDVVIATPGRLLDLMNQGHLSLRDVEFFVLDEADRMLDMGFVHDIKKLLAVLPKKRQSLFFSATMAAEIVSLANVILNKPSSVTVTPVSSTVEIIEQSVYFVDKANKNSLLMELLKDQNIKNVLVFTRTKHGADKVVNLLVKNNVSAEAIHGNKSQNAREKALYNFKTKQIKVLIATDIAARGIDIDELSHVVNYDLPEVPETYIHRIGRTGRAGFSGVAISFCSPEEMPLLKAIEKHIHLSLKVEKPIYFTHAPKEKKNIPMHSSTPKKQTSKQSYQVSGMNKGPTKNVETETKHQSPYHAKKKKYWDKQLKDRYKSKQK